MKTDNRQGITDRKGKSYKRKNTKMELWSIEKLEYTK